MKYIFIISSFILLASCSKKSENIKIIANKSLYNLKILILEKQNIGNNKNSYLIKPNSKIIIEEIISYSGPLYGSRESCVKYDTDSIVVELTNAPLLKISKNLNNSNNWSFSKTSSSKGVNTECKAIITDNDIVPK